jgi:FAD/FMN-containing dehydrogenase
MKTTRNKIVYEENINNIKGRANSIVFPESIQEIKNLLKLGTEDIIARGSGTSLTGAVIPKDSIIVDFSKMKKIIELSTSKKTVTVEPGILISELNDELESYGLEFPIEPLFAGIETIGGMIAKNSAGNREIRYNRMINWIESLKVIDGKGEQLKVSKSDLGDFVGMEGTTGIIIEATLRVTSKKERSLTILKASSLKDVFLANKKMRFEPEVCSIDLLSRELSALLGMENKYHLFVEFENGKGSFKNSDFVKYTKLKNQAYKKAALEGYCYISNAKLLIDSLQDFIIYLEEMKIPYLSHLASGVVYPLFKPEQIEKLQESLKFAKKLRARIAYNFGIGMTKKDCLEFGEIDLIKRVKSRHDPNNRLNRDKLLDAKIPKRIEQDPSQKTIEEVAPKKEEAAKEIEPPLFSETTGAPNPENVTLKKPEQELSPEEREKIKKIAFGFFGGGKTEEKQENKQQ